VVHVVDSKRIFQIADPKKKNTNSEMKEIRSRQPFMRLVRIALLLSDLCGLNFIFAITRFWYSNHIPSEFGKTYVYLLFSINLSWIMATYTVRLYRSDSLFNFEIFGKSTLRTFVWFLGYLGAYFFLSHNIEVSRLFCITLLIGIFCVLVVQRFIYLLVFQLFKSKDFLRKKVLIIGYNESAKRLAKYLEVDSMNTKIVGYCENESNVNELTNYPVIGNYHDVIQNSMRLFVTEIYSTIAPEKNESIYQLMQEADQACIRFKLVPDLTNFVRQPVHIDYYGDMPILSLRREPLDNVSNRLAKRVFDLVVSSLAIILVLSWLVPLVGLLVWLESAGPIFFVQKRSGRNNQAFSCFKFRSMRVNDHSDRMQASRLDKRITRVGHILRKTNLDEFPQFVNVFLGDMSIVGPRPHMLKHTQDYSKLLGNYMVRQFLKPGITGWAQVNGHRGETKYLDDMRKRVDHDIWYMENWSLWMDCRIILLTLYTMFRGDKNAF
jgi:putative colanic acid biosynthesis UDP-glucose lipid carrier transferase